jgi:hypothetical protein
MSRTRDLSLIRDRGASLMLEIVLKFMPFDPSAIDWFWEAYRIRLREEREQAMELELARYRFALLHRAGRDVDWIRSYRLYGVPPVPDD